MPIWKVIKYKQSLRPNGLQVSSIKGAISLSFLVLFLLLTTYYLLPTTSYADWNTDLGSPCISPGSACAGVIVGANATTIAQNSSGQATVYKVTLTCSDAQSGGSGCNSISYNGSFSGTNPFGTTQPENNAEPASYFFYITSDPNFNAGDGPVYRTDSSNLQTNITYWATDGAGNVSNHITVQYTLAAPSSITPPPTTVPVIFCSFSGPGSLQTNQQGTYTDTSTSSGGANINSWSWTANGGNFTSPFSSSTNWSSGTAGNYTITLLVQDTNLGISQQCSSNPPTTVTSTTPPPVNPPPVNPPPVNPPPVNPPPVNPPPVNPPPPAPITSSFSGPTTLNAGQTGNYTSTCTGTVTSFFWSADGGTYSSPPGTFGSSSIWSSSTTGTFNLTLLCSGPLGSAQSSASVNVIPASATPPPPPPNNTLPWLQTTGGDVHSNQGITTPSRP